MDRRQANDLGPNPQKNRGPGAGGGHALPDLGWTWTAAGASSRSLRAVVPPGARLDARAVAFFWGTSDEDPGAGCFEGVARTRAPLLTGAVAAPIGVALADAVAACAVGRAAVALSGGLDSAAVLACAAALGVRDAFVLAPVGMGGYDERDAALEAAAALGARATVVEAREEDFVAALPECVAACGAPLYNLHPVGKYLLARAAAAAGVTVLISGDGADEAARGEGGERWLPIAAALAEAGGARLACPFTRADVRAALAGDTDKRALRAWLADRFAPAARRPKRPRYAPAMDLSRWIDPGELAALGAELGRPPPLGARAAFDHDKDAVRWATLALLARHVRA